MFGVPYVKFCMSNNEAKSREAKKFQYSMYALSALAFYLGTHSLFGLPGFSTTPEINWYGIGFGIFLAVGGTVIRLLYRSLKLSQEISEENERNRES